MTEDLTTGVKIVYNAIFFAPLGYSASCVGPGTSQTTLSAAFQTPTPPYGPAAYTATLYPVSLTNGDSYVFFVGILLSGSAYTPGGASATASVAFPTGSNPSFILIGGLIVY
jgi:hypothetical protein